MKTFKLRGLTALFAVAVLVVNAPGCLTAPQVQGMIDKANEASIAATRDASAASIAASLDASAASIAPFPSTAADADASAVAEDAATRISNWITQHQDQPRIVDPLRLRLAYLLLQQGKPGSAQVVYDDITDGTTLPNELQQELYESWEAFKWWWTAKGKSSFSATDTNNATDYYKQLVERADQSGRTPYLRSMLHQFAIDIRFKHAVRTAVREQVKSLTEEGLDKYGAQFSSDEKAAIQALNSGETAAVDGSMLRWYVRVPVNYACFVKLWERLGIAGAANLTPTWAQTDPPTECPLDLS